MMNLCVNARDAMPEGGTLTLSARNVELDEAYARTHLDAKAAAYVMFMVEDTGTGMSPQTLEKIFDPFFTTKDPGKGTGLGLSTTLSIVKGHGGFINVYSEPGRGSSFRVYVPVAPQPSGPAAPAPKAALPSGHGELVILIDDEEAVRETTKRALEQHGYRVATAADGSDGVARFVEHRGEVSCIITDMMMPHMDGAATIRTIRRLDPKMKVIAMSGLPANGYVTEARGVGAQAFLTKPYTTELILRTLDEVLRAD
jgi:hypothetical protein